MNLDQQDHELVAALQRALAIADEKSLRLVAIKIAEALDHFRASKGSSTISGAGSKDGS
jgi:hypothetical protein